MTEIMRIGNRPISASRSTSSRNPSHIPFWQAEAEYCGAVRYSSRTEPIDHCAAHCCGGVIAKESNKTMSSFCDCSIGVGPSAAISPCISAGHGSSGKAMDAFLIHLHRMHCVVTEQDAAKLIIRSADSFNTAWLLRLLSQEHQSSCVR